MAWRSAPAPKARAPHRSLKLSGAPRRRLPETSASMVICAAGLVAGRRSTASRALLTATPSPPLHLAPQARPASWSDPYLLARPAVAGSTVSLRRSSSQVRGAPVARLSTGSDACTAPRLASPAFTSSSSPAFAPQIRHGLQTGSSSFLWWRSRRGAGPASRSVTSRVELTRTGQPDRQTDNLVERHTASR